MTRHAYLITAYNNFPVLKELLALLDDSRNDIYIHVDKKAKDFNPDDLAESSQASGVVFIPRRAVYWGDYSQVRAVLDLFKAAVPTGYAYYHLISGSDLPLWPQARIHDFFDANHGREFVGFASKYEAEWVSRIHILNRTLRSPRLVDRLGRRISRSFLSIQRRLEYDVRSDWHEEVRKGSDWFSITHDLAVYLLGRENDIERMFRWAHVPSEFYVQTLVWNSRFRGCVYDLEREPRATMRYVDWVRGSPYTLRLADLPELMSSDYLFARKFDWSVDPDLVRELVRRVQSRGEGTGRG